MAQFIGYVVGNRGEAHRIGHKNGGLTTRAQSWHHKIETHLYHANGIDCARVTLSALDGTRSRVLFDGPMSGGFAAPVRQTLDELDPPGARLA